MKQSRPCPSTRTLSRATASPLPPVSAINSLLSTSPKAALKSSPRPTASTRPRSRTVVSHRGSSGKTEPCAQQNEVGYHVPVVNEIALAKQSLASDRLSPSLLRGSGGRRAELGEVHALTTPIRILGERQLSGVEVESPVKRTRPRARGPDSPHTKTLLNSTVSNTASGLSARSASLVHVRSPGLSSGRPASPRITRNPLGQRRTRSSTLLSSPTRSSSSARSSIRTPLVSSTLHNVPRAGRPPKSKGPRDLLHTITEDAQENNTADLVDERIGLTHRQKGSLQHCSSPPSTLGSAPTPVRNTRNSGGLRGRSASKAPPPSWH